MPRDRKNFRCRHCNSVKSVHHPETKQCPARPAWRQKGTPEDWVAGSRYSARSTIPLRDIAKKISTKVDRINGCWIWSGTLASGRVPNMQVPQRDGTRKGMSVRKVVYDGLLPVINGGRNRKGDRVERIEKPDWYDEAKESGERIHYVARCGQDRCVSPYCTTPMRYKEFMAYASRTAATDPVFMQKRVAAQMASNHQRKYSEELAMQVREFDGSTKEAAQQFGITERAVHYLRGDRGNGSRRKFLGNPFGQLVAHVTKGAPRG